MYEAHFPAPERLPHFEIDLDSIYGINTLAFDSFGEWNEYADAVTVREERIAAADIGYNGTLTLRKTTHGTLRFEIAIESPETCLNRQHEDDVDSEDMDDGYGDDDYDHNAF